MDTGLKQRLVGASVIIALAVIFIPMIFDDTEMKHNQEISIEIPNEPDGLKHKIFAIDSTNPVTEKEVEIISNNQTQKEVERHIPVITKEETIIDVVDNTTKLAIPVEVIKEPAFEKAKKTTKEKTAEVAKKVVKKTVKKQYKAIVDPKTKIGTETTYRIVYGSFSQQKNAQQLKAKIINSGNNALVEKDTKTDLYKVFSRQYTSKRAVDDIVQVIQKQNLKIGKPSIQTLNKEQSIATELQLDTGWIIQIGSFSNKINSLKLRDKIRIKGHVSFVDEIMNSKKQLRYRVRVGPYATREDAQLADKKLIKQMKLKGIIKPHEKEKVVNK